MSSRKKLHLSRRWFVIIFLGCIGIVDIGIFYTAPLRYLYPVTFDDNTKSLKIAAILFNDFSTLPLPE